MKRCVCFLFVAIVCAEQALPQSDTLAQVEGRVVHSVTGEPIPKAQVTLGSYTDGNASELVATTDASGQFRFADVSPGAYKLTTYRTGFLGGGYGEVKPEDEGSLLRVKARDRLQNLTLRLFPAGTIGGQVLDPDGDPVPGYQVVLWTRRRRIKGEPNSPADDATTNQAGEYRFEGLLPKTYFVSASPESSDGPGHIRQTFVDSEGKPTNLHELRTFYPSALSLAEAQSVRIESGQEQTGVDIRLRRGPLLTVKGRIAGKIGPEYQLSASLDEGRVWTSEPGKILANGAFEFDDLPPGKHRLVLMGQSANGPMEIAVTEVSLADESVSDVVLAPFTPAQLRVRGVLEGPEDKPLTAGSVFLDPVEENDGPNRGQTQFTPLNGTYVLNNVSPGTYQIGFTNRGKTYLKSVQSEGRMLDPNSIDVADGANLDLLLTYSKNLASLSGDVEVRQDVPKTSVHVLLIAEKTSASADGISMPELDQFRHFSSETLAPGKYLAFAAQDDDLELWQNPQFVSLLQSQGSEIELHEKEHVSIHLKLITKDVTDRVRQQLGI